MKLNEKLIKLRKEKGLSQEEFGNEIKVSRQAVSKWENGETKPDIDKIQEIVKKFNLSFDYLLNDEIETEEIQKQPEENNIPQSNKKTKSKKKKILKIIFIILLIYLAICIYKFITFYRFYLIANSFSEENYSIFTTLSSYNEFESRLCFTNNFITTKVGNRVEERAYKVNIDEDVPTDENGPYYINYTDSDKEIACTLNYDEELDKYIYHDRKKTAQDDEELKSLLDTSTNIVKDTTLGVIPSGFKEIFLASINPIYYYVDIINREFRVKLLDGTSFRYQLNNDYLIDGVYVKTEYNGRYCYNYSYDYVPGHFNEDRIKNPLEKYSDIIVYEEE